MKRSRATATARATSTVTAKELKVHTGETIDRVAEGEVVYVTRRGKRVVRMEPASPPPDPAKVREQEKLIDLLYGSEPGLPSSDEFARRKHRDERIRDRCFRRLSPAVRKRRRGDP